MDRHPEETMKAIQAHALAAVAGLMLAGPGFAQEIREPGLLPPISLQSPFSGEPLVVSEANPTEPVESPVGQSGRSTLDLLTLPSPAAPAPAPDRSPGGSAARGERLRAPGTPAISPARRWWTAKLSTQSRFFNRTARTAPAER
jgi:hypothetical protein